MLKLKMETVDQATQTSPDILVFSNPLILGKIFGNLPVSVLSSCRLVNKAWKTIATESIRKSIKNRLLFCADGKCTMNLKKMISAYKAGSEIPFSKAVLILDHLPQPPFLPKKTRSVPGGKDYGEGELELLLQLSDLFVREYQRHRQREHCSHSRNSDGHGHYHDNIFNDVPPRGRNGDTVKLAVEMYGDQIENLIVNMTLHTGNPGNMEYWLRNMKFPNLTEVDLHITRNSPDDLSACAVQFFFNSLQRLRVLSIRKLAKHGERLLAGIIQALIMKTSFAKLKSLSLEVLTDDKSHLETLAKSHLLLERLTLIYLGGEVSFLDKMDLIKQFLNTISTTLQFLHTHLPLFNEDQECFPKLPKLKELRIDKVVREFAVVKTQLFGFDFQKYFPNLQKICFKDYDLWKNMQLKTFPMDKIRPCPDIKEIALPDLCFDAPLMERYYKKFPNLRKLSIVVSYASRFQKQCSFCTVYSQQPQLKELHVSLLEIDVATCDDIFIGMTENTCKQLIRENREPKRNERGLSVLMLRDLEILKITSVHDKRVLGITDRSVKFGFIKMPSLRHLIVGPCLISANAVEQMSAKFDVTILSNLTSTLGLTDTMLVRMPSNFPHF